MSPVLTDSEKIETIVLSRKSGALGTFVGHGMAGSIVVLADGRTFGVWTDRHGWNVRNGDFIGIADTLLDAARLALNP